MVAPGWGDAVTARAGFCMLVAGSALVFASPTRAQDVGACQQALLTYRQSVGVLMQNASDVPAALHGRAALADEEADARAKCSAVQEYYATIDMTREDIDLSLGQSGTRLQERDGRCCAACEVSIRDRSRRYSYEAAETGMLSFLKRARADAEELCKDYKRVMGRVYRAKLLMESIGGTSSDQSRQALRL